MVNISAGGHSHSGGSSGAHSHGSGSSGGEGVVIAIVLSIFVTIGIVIMVVHIISHQAALRHDSVLTPQDISIRSAKLTIACREIEDFNGTESVGPPCSSAVKSASLAIQLIGVPPGVSFQNSDARGTYSASCTVIAGGYAVAGGGGNIITGPTRQDTDSSGPSGVSLPSNTCTISIEEPSQAVEIDISRWSVGDSNTGNSFVIRQFTVNLDSNWYRVDGILYGQ